METEIAPAPKRHEASTTSVLLPLSLGGGGGAEEREALLFFQLLARCPFGAFLSGTCLFVLKAIAFHSDPRCLYATHQPLTPSL